MRQVIIISDLISIYDDVKDSSYIENIANFFADYGSIPFVAPSYGVAYVYVEGESNSMRQNDTQVASPVPLAVMQQILDSQPALLTAKLKRLFPTG